MHYEFEASDYTHRSSLSDVFLTTDDGRFRLENCTAINHIQMPTDTADGICELTFSDESSTRIWFTKADAAIFDDAIQQIKAACTTNGISTASHPAGPLEKNIRKPAEIPTDHTAVKVPTTQPIEQIHPIVTASPASTTKKAGGTLRGIMTAIIVLAVLGFLYYLVFSHIKIR